jgi:non-specific serine/threonine protein kinase
VTSRETLRIDGEQEFPVPPLALPDVTMWADVATLAATEAVELFQHRARAVQPGFVVTTENGPIIAAICARLDGLPLAIELAAARIKLLSPQHLLDRLSDRLTLLSRDARDAPARHQTMRDAIAWSYDLLSTSEQALFRRLSVFVGGCTLEATEAVCRAEDDRPQAAIAASTTGHRQPAGTAVFDGIASLTDKSLLIRAARSGSEPRFTMLETIRAFGLEQLDAHGETNETRARMARWYLELTEPALAEQFGPAQRQWQELYDAEHDNLRAVLSWAIDRGEAETAQRLVTAIVRFWYVRGFFSEGTNWAERALASGPTAKAVRARALGAAGWVAFEHGQDHRAIELQTEGLELAREVGDTLWAAQAASLLGMVLEDQGRFVEAEVLQHDALRTFLALGNGIWVPFSRNALGLIAYEQGDIDRAEACFEEALHEFRQTGNSYGAGYVLTNLSKVARQRGDYARAQALLVESLTLRWEYGDKMGIEGCLRGFARLAALTHQFPRAARLFGTAEALREAVGASIPRHHARLDQAVTRVRVGLGEAAFAEAWEAGRAMPLREAVTEALQGSGDTDVPPTASVAAPYGLTPRERDVLRLLPRGLTNREIGELLFITERTAQTHVQNIFTKLGVNSRAEAVALAVEQRGLTGPRGWVRHPTT